jgi:hypothetical protein
MFFLMEGTLTIGHRLQGYAVSTITITGTEDRVIS